MFDASLSVVQLPVMVCGGREAMLMAAPAVCDSALSPCFHGCPAFLHRHFPPHSPPSHPLDLSLCSQQHSCPGIAPQSLNSSSQLLHHLGYVWLRQGLSDSHSTSVQFSLVTQSCPTLCNPMNRSTPGLPVHHQLPEFTQTHSHRVSDAIQPSHPLSSPSPQAPNPSQHQSLFQ